MGGDDYLPLCRCQPELAVEPDRTAYVVNIVLILTAMPLLCSFGLASNTISAIVYTRKPLCHASINRYLAALSCSDFGICLTGLLVIVADSLRSYSAEVDQVYVLLLPKAIPFLLTFQMLSVYLTVMGAVDCFVSVSTIFSFPVAFNFWTPRSTNSNSSVRANEKTTFKEVYCRPSTASTLITILVVMVICYNVITVFELETVKCFDMKLNVTILELCPTDLRQSEHYVTIYKGYMYAITMAFVPFILLIVLTTAILLAMRVSRNQEGVQVQADSPPGILISVVLLFLACNVVSLAVNIVDMVPDWEVSGSVQSIVIDTGNLLVVFNASANFFIYTASSEAYRRALFRICTRRRRVPRNSFSRKHLILCNHNNNFHATLIIDQMAYDKCNSTAPLLYLESAV